MSKVYCHPHASVTYCHLHCPRTTILSLEGESGGVKGAGQGEGSIPYHLQCCAREPFSVCNRKTGTSGLLCCQVTVKMNGWAPGPTWYWTSLIYRTLQPWLLHLRVGLSGKIPKHIPLSVYDFMMSKI